MTTHLTADDQVKMDMVEMYAMEQLDPGLERGHWRKAVYALAQGYKGVPGLAELPWAVVFPCVIEFFEVVDLLDDPPDEDELAEVFSDLWENIHSPFRFHDRDDMKNTLQKAALEPCAEARALAEARFPGLRMMKRLLGVCFALSKLSPDGAFFLSTRMAADAIGLEQTRLMRVWRLLKCLVKSGVLEKVDNGAMGKATVFRLVKNA